MTFLMECVKIFSMAATGFLTGFLIFALVGFIAVRIVTVVIRAWNNYRSPGF